MSTPEAAVRMRGVVKRFGRVRANDGVDLDLSRGEVHALLGENGAGKTTLMNILYGMVPLDAGALQVGGEPFHPRRPADAIAAGVGMVHQHPLLVERLTVAQNMRLAGVGDGSPAGVEAALRPFADSLSVDLPADQRVSDLPMSVRQRLEVLRCLALGVGVLILDEPTAVLTPDEVAGLLATLRHLAGDGCGIVFITHKLTEVLEVADRVTVLRAGRNVGTFPRAEVDSRQLTRLMVGSEGAADVRPPPTRPLLAEGSAVAGVEVRGLVVRDEFGQAELDGIDLEVPPGTIVCLAGVEGNGQRPLAEVLFGLRAPDSGSASVGGTLLPPAGEWRAAGVRVARVPEDRGVEGLDLNAPLWRNLLLGPLPPLPPRLLSRRKMVERARELLRAHGVSPADPLALARNLSGGNQQKLVLAREMSAEPTAMVAVNPTRGLDVKAQAEVHARVAALRDAGAAVLVISTDLDEVLALADRIGVLYRGELTGPLARSEVDRHRVGGMMAGVGANREPQEVG